MVHLVMGTELEPLWRVWLYLQGHRAGHAQKPQVVNMVTQRDVRMQGRLPRGDVIYGDT